MPSHEYREFFLPFYTKETILRVVLRNILEEPALTLKRFLRLISLPTASDYLLDRCWTKEDLETNVRVQVVIKIL